MHKTNSEIINIEAKATNPNATGVVFWSHDKGTAKLIFCLKKDSIEQTIPKGTIVPICLDFNSKTAGNGRGRHVYHSVIEDALNGIVSIVLEDNILGYQGRVDGSIYMELPDQRSLDTAGRFTFDIKRSPIDEEVPELEDYYWQGFNEIMSQYYQTISEIKSEAKKLLDSLKADISAQQAKVVQLEKNIETANTNLNTRIDEINKKIDENDVFTKAESSANVIYQVIGKEKVRMTFTLDLTNKVAGSTSENPNILKIINSVGIALPTNGWWVEPSQNGYSATEKLDDKLFSNSSKVKDYQVEKMNSWNVVEEIRKRLGDKFFIDRGAKNLSDQIAVIKKILFATKYSIWGYGSSPSGNKLSTGWWLDDKQYSIGRPNNTTNEVKLITGSLDTANSPRTISNDGFIHVISYSEPSDGITPSIASIDYASLDITIEISANEHFEYMIAQYHGENPSEWKDVSKKPFETIGNNLEVVDGALNASVINPKSTFYFTNGERLASVASGDFIPISDISYISNGGTSENCPLETGEGHLWFKVKRKCTLIVNAMIKIQTSGSAAIGYCYVHLATKKATGNWERNEFAKVGANGSLAWQNNINGMSIVTLEESGGVGFQTEQPAGKNLDSAQIIFLEITEI